MVLHKTATRDTIRSTSHQCHRCPHSYVGSHVADITPPQPFQKKTLTLQVQAGQSDPDLYHFLSCSPSSKTQDLSAHPSHTKDEDAVIAMALPLVCKQERLHLGQVCFYTESSAVQKGMLSPACCIQDLHECQCVAGKDNQNPTAFITNTWCYF